MKKLLILFLLFSSFTFAQQKQQIGGTTIKDSVNHTTFNKKIRTANGIDAGPSKFTGALDLTEANLIGFTAGSPDSLKYVSNLGPARYSTIQAGLDAASLYSILFVLPGTYTENLTITKGVHVYLYDGVVINGNITFDGIRENVDIIGSGKLLSPTNTINTNNLVVNDLRFKLKFKSIESTANHGVNFNIYGGNNIVELSVSEYVRGYKSAIVMNNGLSSAPFGGYVIKTSGSDLFYGGSNGYQANIWKSSNGGTNWTGIPAGGYDLRAFTNNGTNFFAIYANSGVYYKSTNSGTTWSTATISGVTIGSGDANFLFTIGSDIYYGGSQAGLYKSTNNGLNWTAKNSGGWASQSTMNDIYSDGVNTFYACGYYKRYRTTNGGTNWTQFGTNSGLLDSVGMSITPAGSDLYLGTNQRGVYKSTDDGATWGSQALGTQRIVDLCAVTNSIILAGSYGSGGISRTTDAGATWNTVSSQPIGGPNSFWKDGSTIYVASNNGPYVSTDNGATWTLKTNDIVGIGETTITIDSAIGKCNPSFQNAAINLNYGKYKVDINYSVGSGTVIYNTNGSEIFWNGVSIRNLTSTGHTIKNQANSFNGNFRKIDNSLSEIYAAVEMTSGAQVYLVVSDSIKALGLGVNSPTSTNFLNLKVGVLQNNTNTGANVTLLSYGGLNLEAKEVKNLANTDARVMDLSGSQFQLISNTRIIGNSTWGLIGVGSNGNNIHIRNSTGYNANGSSYFMRNYGATNLTMNLINCYSNVVNYIISGNVFTYPIDSLKVNTNVR